MKKIVLAATAAVIMSCAASTELLKNQTFNITELNGTEYVSMGLEPARILFEDGRLNANLGGNSISAGYKEGADGKLTLEHGLSTKMLVPEEFREDEFISTLNNVTKFTMEGDVLTLLGKDGEALIRAQRK